MTDFLTTEEGSRRALRQLDGPLAFDGGRLADVDLVVSERFKPTSNCSALYLPGKATQVKNVRVLTQFKRRDPAWERDPILKNWAGVRIDHARDLIVDGLHVEGFPGPGVVGYGIRTARLERMSATACETGFLFAADGGGNQNIAIDQLAAWDMWWPAPGAEQDATPSRLRPGGWMGGDGLAGYFTDARIMRVRMTGELFCGLKLVRSKRVCLIDVTTPSLMIQGTEYRDRNADGSTDGSDQIAIRRLMLDKSLGEGAAAARGNGLQVSFNVRGLDVEGASILGAGKGGHGIELAFGCEASFRDTIVSGFNGKRFNDPAWGLSLVGGSSVNADLSNGIRFFDQERTVRSEP